MINIRSWLTVPLSVILAAGGAAIALSLPVAATQDDGKQKIDLGGVWRLNRDLTPARTGTEPGQGAGERGGGGRPPDGMGGQPGGGGGRAAAGAWVGAAAWAVAAAWAEVPAHPARSR